MPAAAAAARQGRQPASPDCRGAAAPRSARGLSASRPGRRRRSPAAPAGRQCALRRQAALHALATLSSVTTPRSCAGRPVFASLYACCSAEMCTRQTRPGPCYWPRLTRPISAHARAPSPPAHSLHAFAEQPGAGMRMKSLENHAITYELAQIFGGGLGLQNMTAGAARRRPRSRAGQRPSLAHAPGGPRRAHA